MADLRDLANQLITLANTLPTQASDLAVLTAKTVIQNLIYDTPVDTSKALSNWQIVLNADNASVIPAYVHGKEGSSQAESQALALSAAMRMLETKKPGDEIWIVNSTPYIRYLNDGSSHQAPAGFVERAILIGNYVVRQGLQK